MRFMGDDAIGIAVAMKDGGDILRLGDALESEFARACKRALPAGMELRKVSDQPHAGARFGRRVRARGSAEAVAIVLLVSFFSLGLRTGLVVAVSIPLVLAMTRDALVRHRPAGSRWARWCWRWACWWTTRSSPWR